MEMSRKSLVSGNCPLRASSVGLHQYLVGCCGPCIVPGIIFNVLTHFEHLCMTFMVYWQQGQKYMLDCLTQLVRSAA